MEKEVIPVYLRIEMKMTINPAEVIMEIKKIMEKEVIPIYQRIEMNIIINPVRVFEFGFDFDNMIETKLCLNMIHLCPHFETKLCLLLIQSCKKKK